MQLICFHFSAKNNNDNLMENIVYLACLLYNIFDTFVVMYFSNEIMVLSDRLAYCLFESEWINQNQFSKKCILIFGERLKQPQQLVIVKIYPLTLQTFVRVGLSALNNFKAESLLCDSSTA